MAGINAILKIDPDARFIDYEADFARTVKGFTQCGKRSLCYTWDSCQDDIKAIRNYGYLLALISLDDRNFKSSIVYRHDICEYLHAFDSKATQEKYFSELKLY